MAEGARLESVYTPKAYRGFESLSLRKKKIQYRKDLRFNYLFYLISLYIVIIQRQNNCVKAKKYYF